LFIRVNWRIFIGRWFGVYGVDSMGLVLYGIERGFRWSFVNMGLVGVEKIEECMVSYIVACSFRNVDDNFIFGLFFWGGGGGGWRVYGPNDGERRILWDELIGLMSWWELQWCIGGYFNVV
jgi:hypothetical protein